MHHRKILFLLTELEEIFLRAISPNQGTVDLAHRFKHIIDVIGSFVESARIAQEKVNKISAEAQIFAAILSGLDGVLQDSVQQEKVDFVRKGLERIVMENLGNNGILLVDMERRMPDKSRLH